MKYWYEQSCFGFYDEADMADNMGGTPLAIHPVKGEDRELLEQLKAQGWEKDPSRTPSPGFLYVRRKVDESLPEGLASGFSSLPHIAETVRDHEKQLATTVRTNTEYARYLRDANDRIEVLEKAPTDLRVDPPATHLHTQNLGELLDVEFEGASWSLTIEGGRRR